MEDIRFNCPHCGRTLAVNRRGAGLRVPCPECGGEIVVPTRAETRRLGRIAAGGTRPPTLRLSLEAPPRYGLVIAGWSCVIAGAALSVLLPQMKPLHWSLAASTAVFALAALVGRRWANGIMLMWCAALLAFLPALDLARQQAPPAVPAGEPLVRPAGRPSAAILRESGGEVTATAEPQGAAPGGAGTPRPAEGVEAEPAVATEPGAPAAAMSRVRPAGIGRPPPIRGEFRQDEVPRAELPFVLYADCEGVHPYVAAGWMGNLSAIDVNDCWSERPYSGSSCIRCAYYGRGNWAGVAWQDPPNNWGDSPGGYDITGAAKLRFWARGENGSERVEFKMGILGPGKKYSDSARATTGRVRLTTQWQKYEISLVGKNLRHIVSGFVWVVEGGASPVVFYLDDIAYE